MTPSGTQRKLSIPNALRIYVPALAVCIIVAYLLRLTDLSPGVRLGASFFAFITVQPLLRHRFFGEPLTGFVLPFTLAVAAITAASMWFLIDR